MLKRTQVVLLLSFVSVIGISFIWKNDPVTTFDASDIKNIGLSDVLEALGDKSIRNPIKKVDLELAKVGEELMFNGKATYKGKKGKVISSYFVCTDCHNFSQEFDFGTLPTPENRLEYAVKNDIPFLPGSTMFGVYNRESFYNKDYVKKYGDLVIDARDTLENAVQLCAKYCSSGRYLESWEEDAIMHYFKKNELTVSFFGLNNKALEDLKNISSLSTEEKNRYIEIFKSNYTQLYDATFLETKPRNERGFGKEGDARNGEKIYEKSCMHCHDNARVTYLDLDKNSLSAKLLWKHRKDYTDESPYQIVRHGTYPITGRKQYMPLYTKEKMSDQQLEDLLAYIKELAKK